MKKLIVSFLTMTTLMTPVSVSARTYTPRELGYGRNMIGDESANPPKIYMKRFVSYKGRRLLYKNIIYHSYGDFAWGTPSKRTYSVKTNGYTKFYRWDHLGNYLKRSYEYEFKKFFKKADLSDTNLRFRMKHNKVYSVIYGVRAWDY